MKYILTPQENLHVLQLPLKNPICLCIIEYLHYLNDLTSFFPLLRESSMPSNDTFKDE